MANTSIFAAFERMWQHVVALIGTKADADTVLPKSGGTMTGTLTLSSNPTADLEAATKQYVDNASDVFIAEYGVTTYEELEAAYNAGKVLICNYGNSVYTLALADSTVGYVFNSGITTAYQYVMYNLALNMWTNDSYGRVLTQYGVLTNKLVAQSNTNYTTKQVRNIILVADGEEIPAGANGDICLVYAP